MIRKSIAVVTSSLMIALLFAEPACADVYYYRRGLWLYYAAKYTDALKMFDYRLRFEPTDVNAMFCRAMCLEKLEKVSECCAQLRKIREQNPDSAMAKKAGEELSRILGDKFTQELRNEAAKKPAPNIAESKENNGSVEKALKELRNDKAKKDEEEQEESVVVPPQARAHYTSTGEENEDMIVDVLVNGHNLKMLFDTGAHGMFLYKKDLDSLGIRIPDNASTSAGRGIGGKVVTKVMKLTFELGGVKKKIDASIAEDGDGIPLLGQGFLEDLEYEIDHRGHIIHFRKARARDPKSKDDMYCVPFRLKGQHLVVDVEYMGGKKTPMIVDTGASSILLSAENFYQLGFTSIPDDSRPDAHRGVGDKVRRGYNFQVEQLRLGPIIVRQPTVSVLVADEAGPARPVNALGAEGLLGQPFFGSWRYTVDMKNKVLRFFH